MCPSFGVVSGAVDQGPLAVKSGLGCLNVVDGAEASTADSSVMYRLYILLYLNSFSFYLLTITIFFGLGLKNSLDSICSFLQLILVIGLISEGFPNVL